MSLTKLCLDGNNLITVLPSRENLVNDIPAGDGKFVSLFLQCIIPLLGWAGRRQNQFFTALHLPGLCSQTLKREKKAFGSDKGGQLYKDVPY
jgi:hypothetical protein